MAAMTSNLLRRSSSSIKGLQAAFRNPSSPFYIAPGTAGPASADEAQETIFAHQLQKAQQEMIVAGFDLPSIWSQPIVWGDHDSFQHVNNVRYVRFFESSTRQSRIEWMRQLGLRVGRPESADALIRGKGVSLIVKSINIQFKRPVRYPDTLLVAHQVFPQDFVPSGEKPDPAALFLKASAYSVTQSAFVAHTQEVVVWYDYDTLKKCEPSELIRKAVYNKQVES